MPLRAAPAALVALLLLASIAHAGRDDALLAPLLEVQVLDREILAIDAEGGGQRSERIERGEHVLYTRSEGRVGIAVTDRRLLAIATRSGAWQEARLRKEIALDDHLGDVASFVGELLLRDGRRPGAARLFAIAASLYGAGDPRARRAHERARTLSTAHAG